jgi:hypothetical protein
MLRRLLPPATALGAALLAVCVTIVLTACTTPSPRRDAEPPPIAWQATDFRAITRTVGCFAARFGIQGRLAPAWHILLTGTNNHGQPVRVVIDLSHRQPYAGSGYAQSHGASHIAPRYQYHLHYVNARDGPACRAAAHPSSAYGAAQSGRRAASAIPTHANRRSSYGGRCR